ncbi:SMR family transporter [Arthrobacter sp. NPDC089319]|uniref:DMT family transporter n=1 Tax=Arthrobacter sp. NPDC089319 TaxID=3155915 RepID=UPI0034169AF8
MKNWLLLAGAIMCEVAASLSLKAALGAPALYVVVVVGYVASFAFLAAVLRAGVPVGVAYGIWGALGVALTAVLAAVLFHEPLTTLMLAGMALAVAGVVLVQWGASRAAARTSEQAAS